MKVLLSNLFEYNYRINEKFIDAITTAGVSVEELVRFFSHILNAHIIWLERIEGKYPTTLPWDLRHILQFREMNLSNYQHTIQLLSSVSLADLEKTIPYFTSKGEPYRNIMLDIFMHIINHSTHHRAQIALLFRQNNIVPPTSDYIFYRRDKPG